MTDDSNKISYNKKNIKVKVNIVNEDEDEELRELIELEREFDELLKK